MPPKVWIERLSLTNFRSYSSLSLITGSAPVVLLGANGAGKTNLLEAVSLLAPGQGLRRAPMSLLARQGGAGDWAVAARLHRADDVFEVGTGRQAASNGDDGNRTARIVRIDGVTQSGSGALADLVEMVWLTPASDGLFTGPAAERRRFLDRLVLCFDPAHRTRANQFERAMRQRNRLFENGVFDQSQFAGLEKVMAEAGVAVAAARLDAVAAIAAVAERRRARAPDSPFPWARTWLEGRLEKGLEEAPAVDVEDAYAQRLAETRERDRAAGRTLSGPHRTDLIVEHGPKGMPAHLCSTGEQKTLLIGLVLAHAEMARARRDDCTPILLLDEIAAHLDVDRRAALFDEILMLGTQAWMTGTDRTAFEGLEDRASFFQVADSNVTEF